MPRQSCIEGDEGWLLVALAVVGLLSSYVIARAARHADSIKLHSIANDKDFMNVCSRLPSRWSQVARPSPEGWHHVCCVQSDAAHVLQMQMSCDRNDVIGRGTDDGGDSFTFRGRMKGDTMHGTLWFVHGRTTCVRLHWVDDPKGKWPMGWYGMYFIPSATIAGMVMLCDHEIDNDLKAKCMLLRTNNPWKQSIVHQYQHKKSLYELLFPPSASAAPMVTSVLQSRGLLFIAGGFVAACSAIIVNGTIATISSGLPRVFGGWWAALVSLAVFGASSAYCSREGYRWHATVQIALWMASWGAAVCTFIVAILFDYHAMAVTNNANSCTKGIGVVEQADWMPNSQAELVVEPSCRMEATCTCIHIDTCDAPEESSIWTAECLVFEPYGGLMNCNESAVIISWHMALSIALCVLALLLCVGFLCALPIATVHHKRRNIVYSLLCRFEVAVLSCVSMSWDSERGESMLEDGVRLVDDETTSLLMLDDRSHNGGNSSVRVTSNAKAHDGPAKNGAGIQRRRWLDRFRVANTSSVLGLRLGIVDDSDVELIEMTAHQEDLTHDWMFETSRLSGVDKPWLRYDDGDDG